MEKHCAFTNCFPSQPQKGCVSPNLLFSMTVLQSEEVLWKQMVEVCGFWTEGADKVGIREYKS